MALPPVRRANAAAAGPDADGYSPVYIDDGSRRPSKQPRKLPPKLVKKPTRKRQAQEEAFSTLPGKTTVAVSFEDGRKFAVGQVLGRPITLDDGRFGRNFSVTEVIDRSAFDYPALLQDPRVFFPVPTPSVLAPDRMTILLAGCGDLGTEAGLRFAAAGHRVVGWRRSPEKLPAAIEGVAADLGAADLPPVPADTTAVVVAVAADSPTESAYRAAYVDGSDARPRRPGARRRHAPAGAVCVLHRGLRGRCRRLG